VIAALGAGWFAVRMLGGVRWWRTRIGRQEALTGAVFAVVFGLAVFIRVLGFADYPYRDLVTCVVWGFIAACMVGKAVLFELEKRDGARADGVPACSRCGRISAN